jgi:DNA-binding response OmpR family regulator
VGGHTILVVDDESSIRLLVRVNLELDGHRVLEAPTIDAARRTIERMPVHLVLLDVHIADGDGLGFLAELRAARPELRVAMLTGSVELERVRSAGPDAVLGKPFNLEDLRETARRLCAATPV